jgi:zinc protease
MTAMKKISLVLVALWVLFAVTPARAVEVQSVTSPGGIEAWLVEDHSIPVLSVKIAFRGGAALDPEGKDGLATMTAALIDEGAGELDSQAFQGRLDDLSIDLSFDANLDSFEGTLRTLTENRDAAFDMLRLALTEPRFDKEPVARIRAQLLARLARQVNDPDDIAWRTFRRLVYPDHPYGRPTDGTPESIGRITRDDLVGFVAHHFAKDNLVVGVAGDITPEELAPLLDKTFDALKPKATEGTLSDVVAKGSGDVVVVEQDVPQTSIVLGQQGIRRNDPDFYAAYVVNFVLGGGGFSSRLFEEVREKRGLAYSVYSYLSPYDHGALVVAGVGTENGRAGKSLEIIREQWARIAKDGLTEEDLEHAKRYLTGSFPLRLTTTENIADMLIGMQLEHLGIDYIDRRNGYIEAVTLEDANRVAKRLYEANALAVVAVGQPDGIVATRQTPPSGS